MPNPCLAIELYTRHVRHGGEGAGETPAVDDPGLGCDEYCRNWEKKERGEDNKWDAAKKEEVCRILPELPIFRDRRL